MPLITSLQNPRVKDAVRLRDRRHREKQGRILIDGARELRRAIAAGVKLLEVVRLRAAVPQRRRPASAGRAAAMRRRSAGTSAKPVFERLAFGQRAEGVLGVAEMPRPTLAIARLRDVRVGVAVQLPPQHATQLLRWSPCWKASRSRATSGPCCAAPTPPACRPSSWPTGGPISTTPTRSAPAWGRFSPCRCAKPQAATCWRGCASGSSQIVAARVDGSVPYTEVDYRGPTAIVLGSEAAGLSPIWTGDDITAVRLPMLGAADSLNVSVTAAVLFYEALRQRTHESVLIN